MSKTMFVSLSFGRTLLRVLTKSPFVYAENKENHFTQIRLILAEKSFGLKGKDDDTEEEAEAEAWLTHEVESSQMTDRQLLS